MSTEKERYFTIVQVEVGNVFVSKTIVLLYKAFYENNDKMSSGIYTTCQDNVQYTV